MLVYKDVTNSTSNGQPPGTEVRDCSLSDVLYCSTAQWLYIFELL